MPFFPPVVHSEKHKKIKLGCDSLQVQKPKKYKEKIKKIYEIKYSENANYKILNDIYTGISD